VLAITGDGVHICMGGEGAIGKVDGSSWLLDLSMLLVAVPLG
jgi:hypothetical protein